jgi:hypothetical protein
MVTLPPSVASRENRRWPQAERQPSRRWWVIRVGINGNSRPLYWAKAGRKSSGIRWAGANLWRACNGLKAENASLYPTLARDGKKDVFQKMAGLTSCKYLWQKLILSHWLSYPCVSVQTTARDKSYSFLQADSNKIGGCFMERPLPLPILPG